MQGSALIWIILVAGAALLLLLTTCYLWISLSASPFIFNDAGKIPFNETVLVLGTAKLAPRGGINRYYQYRMEAAATLYQQGKAVRFLVSGAGRRPGEDEAGEMRASLIRRGIPPGNILMDEQGFRTFDSLLHCSRSFNEYKITAVSQRFHVERAVFTGRRLGMNVTGFCAPPVGGGIALKMTLRESLARVRCILDILRVNNSGKNFPQKK